MNQLVTYQIDITGGNPIRLSNLLHQPAVEMYRSLAKEIDQHYIKVTRNGSVLTTGQLKDLGFHD